MFKKIALNLKTPMLRTAIFGVALLTFGSLAQAAGPDNMPDGRQASEIVNGVYPATYFPNTEILGEAEIRITALGTGMPNQTRAAVSISYLVELGNGDKFLFDVGTGSMVNVAALMIPYAFLDKVFLTHLHTDHWGDLLTLWAGGWTAGRTRPLRVWGPTGETPDMGTAYAIEKFLEAYNWDATTRNFVLSPEPGKISVTEFDYKAVNAVVYEENGVTIRSLPEIGRAHV